MNLGTQRPARPERGRVPALAGARAWILLLGLGLVPVLAAGASAQSLPRDFSLPSPLFAAGSAWRQRAEAAAVLAQSRSQILLLYRVLLGDRTSLQPPGLGMDSPFPYMYVVFDDYSLPVFRLGQGRRNVLLRDYEGQPSANNPKLPPGPAGRVSAPNPAGQVRPSGPRNRAADGHLVLYDPSRFLEYDFWQATTQRDAAGLSRGGGWPGRTILEAGAIDYFDVRGPGANPVTYSSATATGAPLLAGLLLPEDVERGSIDHALACAIPGLRNTNQADPSQPLPADYFHPASTTETDYYNTDPLSLAAGQRLRLKRVLFDEEGQRIEEAGLARITRLFLRALRVHGAYLRDNAGGFVFYAEDIHTAVLDLTAAQVNALVGRPAATPLPAGKTKWQLVIEKLNQDLEGIPLAAGPWRAGQDPAGATADLVNFEVVRPAAVPAGYRP